MYIPSQTARQLNTHARANQNARVQFVQTKYTRTLFVQSMMHTAAESRLVCTRVQCALIATSSIFRTHSGFLRAFSETCRVVQLLHACAVKFKLSCTVLSVF